MKRTEKDDQLAKTAKWIRDSAKFAREDDALLHRIQHPTMLLLRQALNMMGQASRDIGWTRQNDPKGKLKHAMEIVLELTSTARK
jgi:hypothetical protein